MGHTAVRMCILYTALFMQTNNRQWFNNDDVDDDDDVVLLSPTIEHNVQWLLLVRLCVFEENYSKVWTDDGRWLKFSESTRTKWWDFEHSSQGRVPGVKFLTCGYTVWPKVTKFGMVILYRRGEGFRGVAPCPNFWRDPLLSLLPFDFWPNSVW